MPTLSQVLDPVHIRKNTPGYRDMKVYLRKHRTKGTSMYARKQIRKGQIIAYYRLKVYRMNKHRAVRKGMYAFVVYTKKGNPSNTLIGDLYSGSLGGEGGSRRGIPSWGHFANEPSGRQRANAFIDMNMKGNFRVRKRILEGDEIVYKLVAGRTIRKGEEIVWCYGDEYRREYEANC